MDILVITLLSAYLITSVIGIKAICYALGQLTYLSNFNDVINPGRLRYLQHQEEQFQKIMEMK